VITISSTGSSVIGSTASPSTPRGATPRWLCPPPSHMRADYARRLFVSQEARAERRFCDADPMKRSLGRFAPSRAGCEVHAHDRIETNGLTVTTVVGALPHEHEIAQPLRFDVPLFVYLRDAKPTDEPSDTVHDGEVAEAAAVVRENMLARLATESPTSSSVEVDRRPWKE
jgi:hypothetical protein